MFRQKRIFIAWVKQDTRASSLAHHLRAKIFFIHSINSKNKMYSPLKYIINTFITLNLLNKENPDVIFAVNPPVFAVLVIWMYCIFNDCTYIVDTHSAAFTAKRWSIFLWLYRFLSKRALINILHNKILERKVANWGAKTINMGEVIYQMETNKIYPLREGFNVVYVSIYDKDEPLSEVIEAARKMPSVNFYITGSLRYAPYNIIKKSSDNVIFTDFLSNEMYVALLKNSDIVICLTKNDNTMQNGAYEALTLGCPIITSNWPVLSKLYYKGSICIDNSSNSLINAINEIKKNYPRYIREVIELKAEFQSSWEKKFWKLLEVLDK
ncbi:MAG: glycosyltransferase [Candidatus Helarchaeota archaeon]